MSITNWKQRAQAREARIAEMTQKKESWENELREEFGCPFLGSDIRVTERRAADHEGDAALYREMSEQALQESQDEEADAARSAEQADISQSFSGMAEKAEHHARELRATAKELRDQAQLKRSHR